MGVRRGGRRKAPLLVQERGMKRVYRALKENTFEVTSNLTQYLRLDAHSITVIFLSLIIFSQFCSLTYSISLNVDSWPIINAHDNDGANAIRVSENSFWFKNNGFYPYGNLYFNLAQTVALFDPLSSGPRFNMHSLASDKGHHFALMLVSLCSLYGIAYVIASVLAESRACRLLSLFVLIGVFIKSEYWMTWVFRAHPDMLFSFFVAIALYLTVRYMITKSDSLYYLSSSAWGLALATKLTTVFYLPMLITLFIPPVRKAGMTTAFRYYAVILASYLLAGFPQNFVFWRHLAFLKIQSGLSVAPTMGSVTEMLQTVINQSAPVLLTIIILRLIIGFFDEREQEAAKPLVLMKAGGLVLFPLATLLSQRILTLHDHYTLPIAACLFVLVAFLAKNVTKRMSAVVPSPVRGKTVPVLLILISILLFKLSPNAVPTVLAVQTEGRTEARAFVAELAQYQRENLKILADPYTPWDENEGKVSESFFRTIEDIGPGKADILALSREYYGRYLQDPPSLYVQRDIPNWRDVCKFYAIFAHKEQAVDPYGNRWVKVHSNPRGWEIWKLEK